MADIYLDYAADTPPDMRVLECYVQTAQTFANPNAAHAPGRAAKSEMDKALSRMADLLHVRPDEIIFTSGASEANNLAVKGIALTNRRRGRHIISTFLEHSSVSGALTYLQEQGWEIDLVHVEDNGQIDLAHLRKLLREDTVLCAVCAEDSELGTVQPVTEIRRILDNFPNCRLHVDATQCIGKLPFDLSPADTVSFAPHKFYGLKGCGVLYKKQGTVLEPLIHGGASTTLYRSGTPDPAAAAACVKALELALDAREERYAYVSELNQFLREQLAQIRGVRINSPDDAAPFILNVSVQGIKGEEMRRRLDARGVSISVKSACSVPNTPSRAVFAVTHDRKNALSSWRISLSHLTKQEELKTFLQILQEEIH